MVFHGHSKFEKVQGLFIYANYGSREDFERLKDEGVNTRGSIAIVRYYSGQGDRASKVEAAELARAVKCITHIGSAEDDFVLGSDTVQRGAASLISSVVGDVPSSGFAIFPGEDRRDCRNGNNRLVNIPSVQTFHSWFTPHVLLAKDSLDASKSSYTLKRLP